MVGRAVDTIVWSSEARNMPSMRAPRITRILRCSALSKSWSTGGCAGATAVSGATGVLHVVLQGCREPAQEGPEQRQVVLVPTLEKAVEPGPPGLQHPLQSPPAGGGERDARG